MRKMKVLFSNEVTLDDNRRMRLEYTITENHKSNSGMPYFGIQIIKYIDDDLEIEEIKGVSFSKEKVEKIAQILFQHIVTPISMVEIVDNLITLEAV